MYSVALLILYLAWMVGAVCDDLGTAKYLSATLYTKTPYLVLPVALFLLSGLIAFSTGSSWSTMTILLPLVVGLAFRMGEGTELGGIALMVLSIGAVLEGAIFGDHCSPISDTTVMSSVASGSDHIDHVRTQARGGEGRLDAGVPAADDDHVRSPPGEPGGVEGRRAVGVARRVGAGLVGGHGDGAGRRGAPGDRSSGGSGPHGRP